MNEALLKMLAFITALQIFNTIINVIHKLEIIHGPPAHVAIAILSMIIIFGYSGILNQLFLNRKLQLGRKIYLSFAFTSQLVILTLAILAWVEVITYFHAIAVIHAILGLIVAVNFVGAVLVVDEQEREIKEEKDKKRLMNK